jgi:2'-5' RNA ligase
MRLFVALALPDEVAGSLQFLQSGVPGARWSTRDQLHVTLRFIGDVDGPAATAVDDALSTVRAPAFHLILKDVGQFGGKNPTALWAGVQANPALMHLQRKIESALQRAGLAPETRKYKPHVTLARLRGAPRSRVIAYLTEQALFTRSPFEARGFVLYSSHLTPNGSLYRAEKAYQLQPSAAD